MTAVVPVFIIGLFQIWNASFGAVKDLDKKAGALDTKVQVDSAKVDARLDLLEQRLLNQTAIQEVKSSQANQFRLIEERLRKIESGLNDQD